VGAANSLRHRAAASQGFSPIWHNARSSRRAPGVTPTVQIELPAWAVSLLDAPQIPGALTECATSDTRAGGY